MHDLIPLAALRRGESAEVCELVGSPERIRRLEELGLRHGVRLDMLRQGSPCIFRIDGTTMCFRHEELVSVMVRLRMSA
jgi:Fe2+ transport system protein FeoA